MPERRRVGVTRAALVGIPLLSPGPARLAGGFLPQVEVDRFIAVVLRLREELRMEEAVLAAYLQFESKLSIPFESFGSTTFSTTLVPAFTASAVVNSSWRSPVEN